MKSSVPKRSMLLGGRRTSVSLEDPFWNAVKEIAASRNITPTALLTEINADRHYTNFSSAIRLYVLDYYKTRATNMSGGIGGRSSERPGEETQHTDDRTSHS
jgi:predicted DNA-binding ribbon-helix-helix protein